MQKHDTIRKSLFCNPNVIIDLDKNRQWLLKSLDEILEKKIYIKSQGIILLTTYQLQRETIFFLSMETS